MHPLKATMGDYRLGSVTGEKGQVGSGAHCHISVPLQCAGVVCWGGFPLPICMDEFGDHKPELGSHGAGVGAGLLWSILVLHHPSQAPSSQAVFKLYCQSGRLCSVKQCLVETQRPLIPA